MTELKLYEAVGQFQVIQKAIDDGDAIEEDFATALAQIEGEIQVKAVNIARFIVSLEATVGAIGREVDRLARRSQIMANKAGWLRKYLKEQMELAEIDKVESMNVNISLRQNPPSVAVIDLMAVPISFQRIVPEHREPDKKAILDAWKNNGVITPGCEIVTDKTTLQIK